MKHERRYLVAAVLVLGMALATIPAIGEEYPSRTIRILVPQAPGGLVDLLPRILAKKIMENAKQAVVVENRVGGNGVVAGADVARSAPDGYTLLMSFHALNAMLPHMTDRLSFDPNKDLIPVIHILNVPNVLLIHPSVPASSLQELIAYGKANPGRLTFASQGLGSTGQVAGELFKQLTGLDMVHVPFRGAAPALQALMGGQVTMMFDTVTSALEPMRAGKIRALGVAAPMRVDAMNDIPTMLKLACRWKSALGSGCLRQPERRRPSSFGSTTKPTEPFRCRKYVTNISHKARHFRSAHPRNLEPISP
jgi:tripartite-type tricarboxylate transporter receptor subunit TctC